MREATKELNAALGQVMSETGLSARQLLSVTKHGPAVTGRRRLVELLHAQGWTHMQIAEAVNITRRAVRAILDRKTRPTGHMPGTKA